ncbi:ABC transporter permease [Microlunatus sp. Gsoil 973]|uniref:ABC transporter permease n=1 Tax=Microlunatus sp. Gsoil 973 TaxID=2672569 RepID=UPI0012B47938|nr:ABC transporter permease [Microlunatus sp. Gsoil 973]QGN33015.1 ABC transporter permease subunit [Microlunatus sp. Gsoil 973]
MLVFIVRRLAASILVLLAATFLTFLLVDLTGDPLQMLRLQTPPPSPETIETARHALYLDRSVPERYWLWLTGIGDTNGDIGLLRGKWGPSLAGAEIGPELGERFFVTLRLVIAALLISFAAAVITGVVSAVRQYRMIDHVLTLIAFIGLAMPSFWIASLVKESGTWVNDRVGSTVLFTFGAASPNIEEMSPIYQFNDIVAHLVLPTLALVFHGYASISRFQRASMLEVLNADYVRLARAKGLRNRVVMRRHALRTALIPIVTLGALATAGALAGAVITETVFRWRGLGTFLVEAVNDKDVYAVMAVVLLTGMILIVFNLIADLLYGVLDPRIRMGSR